jgi:hypothetical protein
MTPLLPDLLKGMRPADLDRIGVAAAREQALPLVTTNSHLFGDVVAGRLGGLAGHTLQYGRAPLSIFQTPVVVSFTVPRAPKLAIT